MSVESMVSASAPSCGATGQPVQAQESRVSEQSASVDERGATASRPGRTAAWLGKHVELGLAELGLSIAQYRALGLLSEGSAWSSATAQRLAVRPASVTAMVDGLVARGLVERSHADGDRRKVALTLTVSGAATLRAADAAVDARLFAIASSLPGPDLSGRAVADLDLWRDAMIAARLPSLEPPVEPSTDAG